MATKRLLSESKQLLKNPPPLIIAGPTSLSNIFHWTAIIQGPDDTPFENGVFEASLEFPPDYPLSPPKMKFITRILHPNGNNISNISL